MDLNSPSPSSPCVPLYPHGRCLPGSPSGRGLRPGRAVRRPPGRVYAPCCRCFSGHHRCSSQSAWARLGGTGCGTISASCAAGDPSPRPQTHARSRSHPAFRSPLRPAPPWRPAPAASCGSSCPRLAGPWRPGPEGRREGGGWGGPGPGLPATRASLWRGWARVSSPKTMILHSCTHGSRCTELVVFILQRI